MPVDIVTQQVSVPGVLPRAVVPSAPGPEAGALAEVVRLIEQAERPIVMIGSGAHWSGAADALGRLAETVGLPVFSSNAGRGLLPDAHDWSFGAPVPLGSAFMSALSADLVICLGVRLGYPLLNGAYFGAAKVVRVDIDGAETARNRPGDVNLCADVRVFCEAVADAWEGGVSQGRAAWADSLRAAKSQSRADLQSMIANHDGKLPHPLELALAIGDVVGPDATIVADGGDILTWGIVGLPALGPGRLLTTGVYLGCLGVGIPFAIAAKVARPDEPVILLSRRRHVRAERDGVRHGGPARHPVRDGGELRRVVGDVTPWPGDAPRRPHGRDRSSGCGRITRSCGLWAVTGSSSTLPRRSALRYNGLSTPGCPRA